MIKRSLWPRWWLVETFAAAAILFSPLPTAAQNSQLPSLYTHESYIDELTRKSTLAIDDPLAVFTFVLNSLPDRVKVYPTENYYYFRFIHNGTPYSGNIRIERAQDDKVSLHFAYYETESEWRQAAAVKHVTFGADQGVTLEKVERFLYRVSYGGKSVIFALNDLSQVKPPTGALAPDEKFIGPIFDDSGIRFFLVYDKKLKVFHYILDETVQAAEELFPYQGTDRIVLGKRTGFAYYRDHKLDRKILIGVNETNVRLNTYFDGPFDQLPDAFVEGETLREAMLETRPELRGKIDRLGNFSGGEMRYSIDPYLPYFELSELETFHKCASRKIKDPTYYNCFDAEKLGFKMAEEPIPGSTKKKPAHK
jgi:hypothetical protein